VHIKGNNHQNEEKADRMKGNLCQLFICQGINTRINKELKKLNTKRTDNPIDKWANELDSPQKNANYQ
jgi:hypothetical protein